MAFENDCANDTRVCCMMESLCDNLNSVITCFTENCCFTGLLVAITCDAIKLVTKASHGCPGQNCYGKVTIIPIREINAVTFCNNSV